MPTAVVLGLASQDGYYLSQFLLAKNYRVVGTIRPNSTEASGITPQLAEQVIVEPADLSDPVSLETLVKKYQPDEYYNLASLSVPAASWDKSYLTGLITGLGPVAGLEAIRRFSPHTRFFQATSREIFGSVPSGVATEATPLSPENPYAAAKAYAHFMTQVYRTSYGLFAASGILFNHESPRRPLSFVTRKITAAAACFKNQVKTIPLDPSGQPIIAADGKLHLWDLTSVRDRGFAGDYVEAMWLMLQAKSPADYIIASNSLISTQAICEQAFSHVGLNWQDYMVVDSTAKPVDTQGIKGDFSRIKTDLCWQPFTDFSSVVARMVESDLQTF